MVDQSGRISDMEQFNKLFTVIQKCIKVLEFDMFDTKEELFTRSRTEFWKVGSNKFGIIVQAFVTLIRHFSGDIFENGLLESFPNLLDIILNHLGSEDIFSPVSLCLSTLLEFLGRNSISLFYWFRI